MGQANHIKEFNQKMIDNTRQFRPFFLDIIDPSVTPLVTLIFWISAFLLIGIAHFPTERILYFFPHCPIPIKTLVDLRQFLFLFGLTGMLLPIFSCISLRFKNDPKQIFFKLFKTFLGAVLIYVILSFLAAPYWPSQVAKHIVGLRLRYEFMSQAPFETSAEILFRRLLMPSLAYFLGFSKIGYAYFASICSFVLIWSLSIFIYSRIKINGHLSPLFPFLVTLSLCSSSFVIGCLSCPGFPDPLALFLLLIPTLLPMSSLARLAITTLALITHEGTFFIILPLAIFFYPKRELKGHLALLSVFLIGWIISYHFNLKTALTAHDIIGPTSHRMDRLDKFPLVLFGVFTSFKLFWLSIPAALILLKGSEAYSIRKKIIALLIGALILLLIVVDTTRLTGFAFLAILFSTVVVLQNDLIQRSFLLLIVFLLTLNLLLPTYDSKYHDAQNNTLYYNFSGTYKNIDQFLRTHFKILPLSACPQPDPDPILKTAYYYLGNSYIKHGYLSHAIFSYSKAVVINPNYWQAYSNRALAYYLLKKYDQAWEDVHKVEALGGAVDPNFINALKNKSGRDT